jgi:hypothetical protein
MARARRWSRGLQHAGKLGKLLAMASLARDEALSLALSRSHEMVAPPGNLLVTSKKCHAYQCLFSEKSMLVS